MPIAIRCRDEGHKKGSLTRVSCMSEEEEKRKQQFAALKRYLEQEQARVDREMPGATDKEKTDAVAAKLSDSLTASREKNAIESLTAVLRGIPTSGSSRRLKIRCMVFIPFFFALSFSQRHRSAQSAGHHGQADP